MTIVVATTNPGKIREITAILADSADAAGQPVRLLGLNEIMELETKYMSELVKRGADA